MRQRAVAVSRRAVLRGTAAGAAAAAVAGCSTGQRAATPPRPLPPDPETVLLTEVIADKERIVALYRRAAEPGSRNAAVLLGFQRRHEAHLAELRRRLPRPAAPSTPAPSPSGSPPVPSPSSSSSEPGEKVSIGRLREAERRSAAARPRQIGGVSPALAQLLACIGACEAAHVVALARVP
ncbi:hypothetical protein Skr01_06210 [Sphaerisporangium krabiense]|uniref:Ferritin-like domain-containing protein n=1 Tax=Sphaerisporangium krabiense TaxID=763782 RepID=A0A7W9DRG6_9ACTN|nr:hypothetical protein [Sphaerisporangium krabiense]MBB5628627.1 hypothetical protein [Sphaerisporangium krabiense]GII60536.1 hypothetical protein Skr01_06210 [Sphaerisporangium krabiense]